MAWAGLVLRWMLVLFVVFDQMGAPLQGDLHDSEEELAMLAHMRETDGVLVAIGAALIDKFGPTGSHPSTPVQIHAALSVAASPRKATLPECLACLSMLAALWPGWFDQVQTLDGAQSVDPPPPRTRAASAPLHTRAPPLRA